MTRSTNNLPGLAALSYLTQRPMYACELHRMGKDNDGALAKGIAPVFLVKDQYRVALLEAAASFITTLIGVITDPETGCAQPRAAHHAARQAAGADPRDGGTEQ